ncbi:glycosyltransferase family 4 protein [Patescibacteria group bacterium]|nr:glycosyltransferase family 4 protein [Patescibacteria group bacterium]
MSNTHSSPHIVLAITQAVPGGATSFVYEYAVWLKKKGFKVTIIAGNGSLLFEKAAEAGIPCLQAPFMQREIKPWLDLPAIFALAKLFHDLKPTVVHLNSSKMGVIGSLAARLARVPRVVYCIGGWAFLESIAPWKKQFYAVAERLTAPLKDAIICLSPRDKQAAEEQQIRPRENITVVPNGIDLPHLDRARLSRAEAREMLGLSQERFVFGTVANFHSPKHLPTYVRQAASFLQATPSASLVLIGEGPERSDIERAIRERGLETQVHLLGSREEAHRFLSAFDVFVLPSTKEGMPFSLLEAMAARLPCIVTDVGAHAWMLEGSGSWIIPADTAKALQKAMSEAIQHKGPLVDIGQANRLIVEQRFPLEKTLAAQQAITLNSQSSS